MVGDEHCHMLLLKISTGNLFPYVQKARKQSLYRENFINDIIVAEKAPLNIFDDADQFKLHENEIANMRSKRSRVGLASK